VAVRKACLQAQSAEAPLRLHVHTLTAVVAQARHGMRRQRGAVGVVLARALLQQRTLCLASVACVVAVGVRRVGIPLQVMRMFKIPDIDLLEQIYGGDTVSLAPNYGASATITFEYRCSTRQYHVSAAFQHFHQ